MVAKLRYMYSIPWKHRIMILQLFGHWKNSIWEMLWVDLLIFLGCYYAITLTYRLILVNYEPYQEMFDNLVIYCAKLQTMIPLTFILGFFVSNIMARWWSVVLLVPFIDKWSFYVHQFIPHINSNPELTYKLRSTILRYLNLSSCLAFRDVSKQAQRRFAITNRTILHQVHLKAQMLAQKLYLVGKIAEKMPTVRESLDAINNDKRVKKTYGQLTTAKEIETFICIQETRNLEIYEPEYWVPVQWAMRLITDAKSRNWIKKDRHAMILVNLMDSFRGKLGTIWMYSAFNFPLTYIQTVIIGLYMFLLCEIIAYQYIENVDHVFGMNRDQYFPFFSFLKFIFHMGWFKTAYAFMFPLGESKSDCQISEIIDRNLEMSKLSGLAQDFMYPFFLQEEDSETSRERFKGALREIKALSKEERKKIYEEEQMQRADEEARAENKEDIEAAKETIS